MMSSRGQVESVIRTQYTNESYEVLELFCELIGTRIPVMQASKCAPRSIFSRRHHS